MIVIPPRILRHSGEEHQVQGVFFTVGYPAEIIPEEKGGLPDSNSRAQLNTDAFIRRAAIDDPQYSVGLQNITQVSLTDLVCPARQAEIDLVVPLEGFPDLQPRSSRAWTNSGRRSRFCCSENP